HIEDARIASFNDTLSNIETSFNSYYTDQAVEGNTPTGPDLLADVITAGFMSKKPNISGFDDIDINEGTVDAANIDADEDGSAYVICGMVDTADVAEESIAALDERIEDDGYNSGALQWYTETDAGEPTGSDMHYFAYYLFGENIDPSIDNADGSDLGWPEEICN
ncbi:MAG: hypothetical protein ACOCP4_07245, partial [Candidatus Woesearchaeota archaeon]